MDDRGLADIARYVVWRRLTEETRVQSALDDRGLADIARHVIGCPVYARGEGSKVRWMTGAWRILLATSQVAI